MYPPQVWTIPFGHRWSAGVQDKERVFCIHDLGRAVGIHIRHRLVEIDLHLAVEFDRGALFPAQDDNMFDGRGVDNGLFYYVLELDRLAPPDRHISRDDDLRTCAHDPLVEGSCANPPNTTEWTAPIRVQASMAITCSGMTGM